MLIVNENHGRDVCLSFFTRRVLRKRLSSSFFTIPFESLEWGSYDARYPWHSRRVEISEKTIRAACKKNEKKNRDNFLIQRNNKQAVRIGTNIFL